MNNYLSMHTEFEKEKNRKAALFTLGFAGSLLLLFILYKWPLPTVPLPQHEEFIEVDLGNSETGSDQQEEQLPGQPAPAQQIAYNTPTPVHTASDDAKDVDPDETSDAPAIRKPVVAKPNAVKIDAENKVVKTSPAPTPAVQAPPRPRAVMGRTMGSNGNGGNGAETYIPGGGDGTGGSGNRGSVGGDPNGRGTGTPRTISGVKIINMPDRTFSDEFSESGYVVLDIVVNSAGRLVSATFQPRGSTITNRKQIDIAKRRAAEIDYPKYDGGFKQSYRFSFKVN